MKLKKGSKRVPLKRKYNIDKKAKEHKRRIRKAAKSLGVTKRYKRKDPGIPNSWPWKGELLDEIQKERVLREEEKLEKRRAKREQAGMRDDEADDAPQLVPIGNDLAAYAENAAAASAKYEEESISAPDRGDSGKAATNSTAGFRKIVENVIRDADVILEVLDIRNPQACRSPDVERRVTVAGKRLVLVLNKTDLVPRDVAEAWERYLAREFPVILFKAQTRENAGRRSTAAYHRASDKEVQSPSMAVGTGSVVELLKTYSRDSKTGVLGHLRIGVIGKPNVGKSSVISSLCASRGINIGVNIGAEPGITRQSQEIVLDSKIKLIDSPGVIIDGAEDDANLILCNVVKLGGVKNPIDVVARLVATHSDIELMKVFAVSYFKSATEFLAHIARKRGKLQRGGALDLEGAARAVLQDWVSGRVRHWCLPPQKKTANAQERETISALDTLVSGPAAAVTVTDELTGVNSNGVEECRFVAALAPVFQLE